MNIHVVLVEPTRSWNIGSIARVMNNMGITSLRLVNPCDHLHHKAYALAVNSAHILESARVYQDLGEAVSECELVIGTSARARGQNTAMQNSWSLPGLLENYSKVTDVAVVFGGEENGLNNNDATVCNEMVKIPAFGESTSLNLSQAVMVILYECSKFVHGEKSLPVQKARAPAPSSEVEHMKNHIYSLFQDTGYNRKVDGSYLRQSLSQMMARFKPTSKDVRYIRSILRSIQNRLQRKDEKAETT